MSMVKCPVNLVLCRSVNRVMAPTVLLSLVTIIRPLVPTPVRHIGALPWRIRVNSALMADKLRLTTVATLQFRGQVRRTNLLCRSISRSVLSKCKVLVIIVVGQVLTDSLVIQLVVTVSRCEVVILVTSRYSRIVSADCNVLVELSSKMLLLSILSVLLSAL